jgi:hypothetical protein
MSNTALASLNNFTAQTTRPESVLLPKRVRDVLGRMKVSLHQNVYEADFEYGTQPMRWEVLTANTATAGSIANVIHLPGMGGVRMMVGNNAGDLTIRQSRPYHRYQPGKTMYMATAMNFGAALTNNVQRVGIFDDSNGVFFEQGAVTANNPSGVYCVVRSDAGSINFNNGTTTSSTPYDTKFSYENWYGDPVGAYIDWTKIQMIWIEYAWYGAGAIRWGVQLNGEPYVLHEIGTGNASWSGQSHQFPWSRTGNLPVRYEQRNTGATSANSVITHFGVSVVVEGGRDEQRGFTYSYGNDNTALKRTIASGKVRFPVTSVQMNQMAKIEFQGNSTVGTVNNSSNSTYLQVAGTPWTANQYVGRIISFQGAGSSANTFVGRIANNTANTLYMNDVVANTSGVSNNSTSGTFTPNSSFNYQIGLVNRGQILPQQLFISADAACLVELIVSTASNPVSLTNANFIAINTLGSSNSLASRDLSSNAVTANTGEVIWSVTSPSGGSGLQIFDLTNLFSLYNNIRGNAPDILTLAISTPTNAANVGAQLVAQEAMS